MQFIQIHQPYARTLRICVVLVAVAFFVAGVTGYINARLNPEEALSNFDDLSKSFSFIKDFNALMIFAFIFLNNTIKTLIVVLFGFLFGIVPLLFVVTNGSMLGLVIAAAHTRLSVLLVLLSIVPHGIIEIPAVLLASGYGLWLGYRFYRTLAFHEPFKEFFTFALRRYFFVVVPLLFVAAIIEAFITPRVIELIH